MDEADLDAASHELRETREEGHVAPARPLHVNVLHVGRGDPEEALRPLDQPVEDLAVVIFVEDQPVHVGQLTAAAGPSREERQRHAPERRTGAAVQSPVISAEAGSRSDGRIGFAPSTTRAPEGARANRAL